MEGVRAAETDDVGRCSELLADALASIQGQRGAALLVATDPDGAAPARLVERWLTNPETRLTVGTFEGVVVGLGAGSAVDAEGTRLGRIECLYVEPDARAVGVGQGIVADLVDWLSSKGCSGVDALALPGDRSSKQLLESSGFKARLLVLHRSLG